MKNSDTYTPEEKAIISAAAALWGRKGGQATGARKARHVTSEQARHAINTRWARYRAAQAPPSKNK
jgi:hypothetical protein